MKPEMIEPIYKINRDVLDILKDVREMIEDDPKKAVDMLDLSIKAVSKMNDKLSAMSQVQQIMKKVEKE